MRIAYKSASSISANTTLIQTAVIAPFQVVYSITLTSTSGSASLVVTEEILSGLDLSQSVSLSGSATGLLNSQITRPHEEMVIVTLNVSSGTWNAAVAVIY